MANIGTNETQGEYPQPLVRVGNVQIPIVSGYTTGRLRGDVIMVSGYQPNRSQITLENTGRTSFTVQLREAPDYVSGPFSNLGSAVALVPSGQKTVFHTHAQPYLEFRGTSGSGTLRAQIASQVKWQIMAFDKSDTNYPSVLSKKYPDPSPPPSNL